jgi:K+-sensing histidine kinase KdpD
MLVDVLQRFRPMQARPAWWHYGAAVVLVVMAYAVRVELEGVYHHPFLTFIAALLLSALFLDHGAGVLATLLGAALAPRFFTEPGSGYGLGGADAAVATAAFLGFGLFVAGIFEVLWRTVDRLSDANRRLAEANRRLSLAEHQARSADELKATLLADRCRRGCGRKSG